MFINQTYEFGYSPSKVKLISTMTLAEDPLLGGSKLIISPKLAIPPLLIDD